VPLLSGLVSFAAFNLFGGIPLVVYTFQGEFADHASFDYIFIISYVLLVVCLVVLGVLKVGETMMNEGY
jgi:hypothetical protein